MKINVIGEEIPQEEINAYIAYGRKKYHGKEITELTITPDGDYANLKFSFADVPFDRIRRITGYLVGTTERFNNGKRAEERDRVKHSV
ncbi:MAG: anaerobic ribonucleoside-triphosphate reductase [Ruminococcus sp.]|nr:anaerobic ribonucleoside-triphosphate reductase [Oscillospiraceae bacterium]